jgi:hypothetical protein
VRLAEGLVRGDDDRCPLVACRHQLEEQVGRFGFEGDVAHLVDHQQWHPSEPGELGVQTAGSVGVAEAGHPLSSGGEGDAVTGLAGPDAETGGQVGLSRSRWPQEDHVLLGLHEVEGPEMSHHVALERALVIEVEVLEGLAGREAGGTDAVLAAVVLARRHLAFQAGGQELLMAPALCAGPLAQAPDGGGQRRRLEGAAQVGEVAFGLGGHHAVPVARS